MFLGGEVLESKCIFAFSMGTVTPAATAANLALEQSFDVPSGTPALKTSDAIFVSGPASGNSLVGWLSPRVVDADTIGMSFDNSTAGSLTHAAGVVRVLVVRV
jgi:hypothetical protein